MRKEQTWAHCVAWSPLHRPFETLILVELGALSAGEQLRAPAVGLSDLVFAGVSQAPSVDSCHVLGSAGSTSGPSDTGSVA